MSADPLAQALEAGGIGVWRSARFEDHVTPFVPGDVALVCTDGLVERRGEGLDAGLAPLVAAPGEAEGGPQDLVDAVVDRLHADLVRSDDVAVVAVSAGGAGR